MCTQRTVVLNFPHVVSFNIVYGVATPTTNFFFFYMIAGDLNSGTYADAASTYLLSNLPRPPIITPMTSEVIPMVPAKWTHLLRRKFQIYFYSSLGTKRNQSNGERQCALKQFLSIKWMLLINIYIGENVSIFNSHHLTGNMRLHRSLSSCKPLTLSTRASAGCPVIYSVGVHTYLPHAQHGKHISILKRNFSRATYLKTETSHTSLAVDMDYTVQ